MVGLRMRLHELVVGGADALEGLDQQNDDVQGFCLAVALRPKA